MRPIRRSLCFLIVSLLGFSAASIPLNQILCHWQMDHGSSGQLHSQHLGVEEDENEIREHCLDDFEERSLLDCCRQCLTSSINSYVGPHPIRFRISVQHATMLTLSTGRSTLIRFERKKPLQLIQEQIRPFPAYLEFGSILI